MSANAVTHQQAEDLVNFMREHFYVPGNFQLLLDYIAQQRAKEAQQSSDQGSGEVDERKPGTAWLLEREHEGRPQWITAKGGWLNWTFDSLEALRLARREDADQLCEIVDDCFKVTEHQWE